MFQLLFGSTPQTKDGKPTKPTFNFRGIRSSTLNKVAYDANFQKLRVQFKSGSMYEYDGVEESTYNSLMSASSHGKYFCANIRNSYHYSRI